MPNESVIQVFEDKNVRIMWNEQEEKYYFSIADIVQVLTDSTDVKQYIKRMRARDPELNLKWGTICTPVRSGLPAISVLSKIPPHRDCLPMMVSTLRTD